MTGIILTLLGVIFKTPLLYVFGASEATFQYANSYLTIYLLGTLFVMIGLGMNAFINVQGFAKMGMITVLLGAITNIILDPIFIFVFKMGVKGAALATVISQFISAIWIIKFLTGSKAILKLRKNYLVLKKNYVKPIITLGLSGFIMSLTNSAVQIVCNTTLQTYGGDIYVGVMTVINSIREIVSMPVSGITSSAQSVMGYNYGAQAYERVKKAIVFTSLSCIIYTLGIWLVLDLFPGFFIKIFNKDSVLLEAAIPALKAYYFGFFMMSLQFAGQSTFVALGKSKYAIFFSIFRKIVIVVPLTLILPKFSNPGTMGVFIAEPISNFIGGIACFVTMLVVVWLELQGKQYDQKSFL